MIDMRESLSTRRLNRCSNDPIYVSFELAPCCNVVQRGKNGAPSITVYVNERRRRTQFAGRSVRWHTKKSYLDMIVFALEEYFVFIRKVNIAMLSSSKKNANEFVRNIRVELRKR